LVVSVLLGWGATCPLHTSLTHTSCLSPTTPPFLVTPADTTTLEARPSPSNALTTDNVQVYSDRAVIQGDFTWAVFTDTKSMEPTLTASSQALLRPVSSIQDIGQGDIIAFSIENNAYPIIHRIVATGTDTDGWYAITKGDNVPHDDPYKVRFEQVTGAVVAILY